VYQYRKVMLEVQEAEPLEEVAEDDRIEVDTDDDDAQIPSEAKL
jgi:hypothetical protein